MYEHPLISRLIDLALEEDIGAGDVTSDLMVPADHRSVARIIAREKLIVCGMPLVSLVLNRLDSEVAVQVRAAEGEEVMPGAVLCELSGRTRALLGGERTVLNFLQRLSGVATFTREFIRSIPAIEVLDTRKTTPGWRLLEKLAVRTGGAINHRQSLGDMILVKNNHIDAAMREGLGMEEALIRAKTARPAGIAMEVEVRNIEEVKAALKVIPDMIMLDNMSDREIAECVPLIRKECPRCKIEVSGGVERERLKELADLGVDCVSVGALTRKATFVDISMRIVPSV